MIYICTETLEYQGKIYTEGQLIKIKEAIDLIALGKKIKKVTIIAK